MANIIPQNISEWLDLISPNSTRTITLMCNEVKPRSRYRDFALMTNAVYTPQICNDNDGAIKANSTINAYVEIIVVGSNSYFLSLSLSL